MLCPVGTYKPRQGPEPCTPCPAGTDGKPGYTHQRGATQELDCIPVS